MSSEFKEMPLGSIARVRSGYAFKSADMGETGAPIIKISNIDPPRILTELCERVSIEVIRAVPKIGRYKITEGDTLIAMTGATVGKVGRFPKTKEIHYLNQRVGKVSIVDDTVVDRDFIYYVLSRKVFSAQIFSQADGSAQGNISGRQIESFPILVPPLEDQKAITHILSTLDDKIELNRKTNETLEAMAKALFKSWFVDFDPVRAKAEGRPTGLPAEISDLFPDSFENSELGKIPSGWEVKRLGNLLDVDKGVSYKGDFLSKSNGLPMVNLGCFGGHGSFRNEKMKFYCGKYRDQHLAEAGDLLIANTDMTQNRIILGAVIIIPKWHGHSSFLLSHHVFVARFRENNKLLKRFIYFTLLKAEFRQIAAGHATGTTVLALPKDGIIKYQSVLPSMPLLKVFTDYTESLFSQVDKAIEENNVLSRIRDTLLPKLISGELRIPDAEKILEEIGV